MVDFVNILLIVTVPQNPRMTNTSKVCQGLSGDELKVSCDRSAVLHIQSATYGRSQGCSCQCGLCQELHNECLSENAQRIIRRQCQDKTSCTLQATNTRFGNPCKGFKKELTVVYSCIN